MRYFFLYSAVILAITGCSAPLTQIALPSPQSPQAASASDRVNFHLTTQPGLPSSGRWKSTPVLVDINKDNRLDLALHPRLEQGARVWLQGENAWQDISQGLHMDTSCGGGLEMGDINKDHLLDIAVADHCNSVFVYLGQKDNTWQPAKTTLQSALANKKAAGPEEANTLSGAEDLALGDINEDGNLDIVAAASDEGGFTVFLGDGTGKKWKEMKADGLPSAEDPGADIESHDNQGGWAVDVQLHDINNDKHLDVVASYFTGPHVWLGDGKGHWQSKATGLKVTSTTGIYRKLAVADMNGDGLKDIAIANSVNGAEAYYQKADGTWQDTVDMMPDLKNGATAIALGDLDGDGNIDAVIGGSKAAQQDDPSGLYVVLGDGKGQWHYEPGSQLPSQGLEEVWGLSLADMNGDQRLDLVAATGSSSDKNKVTVKKHGRKQAVATPKIQDNKSKLPHVQIWLNGLSNKK